VKAMPGTVDVGPVWAKSGHSRMGTESRCVYNE
jgi:hypothetical protein